MALKVRCSSSSSPKGTKFAEKHQARQKGTKVRCKAPSSP